MAEVSLSTLARDPIAVLFHPTAVPVVDVFRTLDSLEDQYDLALLDEPERALASYVTPAAAKGIVSDALLLAFALSRQRGRSFHHRAIKSRYGSMEEYCLLTLIVASRNPGSELAREAAAALGVTSPDYMASLASEIGRQIDQGTVVFQEPTLEEFRAMLGQWDARTETILERMDEADLYFKF